LLFKDQKVEVASVNVVNQQGKEKRHGRFVGRRNHVKKAYVCLKGAADLNFVEGVA
jgi:Ribosomal protein L23